MVQFYLLSIILNGVIGCLLIFGDKLEGDATANGYKLFHSSWGLRLILGILAAVTGILKLLSPMYEGKPIYFLGDFLPAIAGLAAGFILIFGFYRENSAKTDTGGKFDQIGDTFLRYRKAVGVILLITAALHFLFPRALFL